MIIDSYRTVETPEGVELALRIAGPAVRGYAWFIDFLIRTAIYMGLSFVFSLIGNFGTGLFLISIFLIEWFYPIFFEVRKYGMTPGKKALGIRVVMEDGNEITLQASFIRNLLRAFDFLPFLYGFGLITMLCNSEFKRLGDISAGTLVVYRHELGEAVDIPNATPAAPAVPLNSAEQKAIIQYAERVPNLNPERSMELANILSDLTQANDSAATSKLLQYANWMMGRR